MFFREHFRRLLEGIVILVEMLDHFHDIIIYQMHNLDMIVRRTTEFWRSRNPGIEEHQSHQYIAYSATGICILTPQWAPFGVFLPSHCKESGRFPAPFSEYGRLLLSAVFLLCLWRPIELEGVVLEPETDLEIHTHHNGRENRGKPDGVKSLTWTIWHSRAHRTQSCQRLKISQKTGEEEQIAPHQGKLRPMRIIKAKKKDSWKIAGRQSSDSV
jgi:hypothetical protein